MKTVPQDITIVAAMAANRVIGRDGGLPWNVPAELAHFKSVTQGKTLVMGRKTFESIGRLLPGRATVVASRDAYWAFPGALVVQSLDEAMLESQRPIAIVGGGEIYKAALPIATKLSLSVFPWTVEGDTYFPVLDESWVKVCTLPKNEFVVEWYVRSEAE